MDQETYTKALSALIGFLEILDECEIRPSQIVELDLGRLETESAEFLACDVMEQIESTIELE